MAIRVSVSMWVESILTDSLALICAGESIFESTFWVTSDCRIPLVRRRVLGSAPRVAWGGFVRRGEWANTCRCSWVNLRVEGVISFGLLAPRVGRATPSAPAAGPRAGHPARATSSSTPGHDALDAAVAQGDLPGVRANQAHLAPRSSLAATGSGELDDATTW